MADLVITSADVRAIAGTKAIVEWGEAITSGQTVYRAADGKYYLADADSETTLGTLMSTGIALTSGAADQTGVILKGGGARLYLGPILEQGTHYYISKTPGGIAPFADLTLGVDEEQTLDIQGATAGTFTLEYDGQVTTAIPYNATSDDVKEALEALSNIDEVVVEAGTLPTDVLSITFTGDQKRTNLDDLILDITGLTGGTAPSITAVAQGLAGSHINLLGVAESVTTLLLLIVPLNFTK